MGVVSLGVGGLLWFPFSPQAETTQPATIPATPTAVAPQDLPDLIQQVRKSVVLIQGKMQGTGFAISPTRIVTNAHVLEDIGKGDRKVVKKITAQTDDGKLLKLKVIKVDWEGDVAVLERSDRRPLDIPFLEGSNDVIVGQTVVAIGSPYGLTNTVTTGIVSAIRSPGTAEIKGSQRNKRAVLQTSAAINPGNSGGPLLNEQGEVLGVVFSRTIDGEGLAFVIPINQVIDLVKKL